MTPQELRKKAAELGRMSKDLLRIADYLEQGATDMELDAQLDLFSQLETAEPDAQLDLFSQLETAEPETRPESCPEIMVEVAPGVEAEQERPRRTVRRLQTKMREAKTMKAGEPLGKAKGYHQRMNIERMIMHRTGAELEAVRAAFNQAVDEIRPTCVMGQTPTGGKTCRFYSTRERDLLIARSVELLNKESAKTDR